MKQMEINNYCTSGDTQIRYKLRGHYHFVATICFNKVSFAGRALAHQSFRHFGLHIIVQALLHGDFFTAKRCVIHFTTLPARYFRAARVLTAKYAFSFGRHFTVFTKWTRLEPFTKEDMRQWYEHLNILHFLPSIPAAKTSSACLFFSKR